MPHINEKIASFYKREAWRWRNIDIRNDPYASSSPSESDEQYVIQQRFDITDQETKDDQLEDWRVYVDDPNRAEMIRDHQEHLSRYASTSISTLTMSTGRKNAKYLYLTNHIGS